jgi:hypothetical protein
VTVAFIQANDVRGEGDGPTPRAVPVDAEGTWCPCVGDHNPNPVEDEIHHLVPLGRPFGGADVPANRRRLCGTAHGSVHVLLRLILNARTRDVPVERYRLAHFSSFTRRLASVAIHALDSGVDRPTTPDLDWVEITWRT